MIDAVYCINLDRRPDRWSSFLQQIPRDWDLPEVKRFRAIDGRELPRQVAMTPGTLGCLHTHRKLLSHIVRKNRIVLILEDDVIFRPQFCENLIALLAVVPDDWEQIYLGGNHRKAPRVASDGLLRCTYTTATHAYIVNPRGAEKLLAATDDYVGHIDQAFGRAHERGEVIAYAPRLWLCGQDDGVSDVMGFNRPARVTASYYDWEEALA